MRIGGFQKFSLIDYPGKMAAIVFTQGCNFRCPYCHNRELVLPEEFKEPIPQEEVMGFLKRRRCQLEGVVITGGEPTEQADLVPFIGSVKELGYQVKLDTNGSRPQVIRETIQRRLVDYIAMDVKTSLEKYQKAIGVRFPAEIIKESIDLIKGSGIQHEFRTTVVQPFCDQEDVSKVSILVNGAQTYRLQTFRAGPKIINLNLRDIPQITEQQIEAWGKCLH
ncbi:MAG: anaerobic ribonucleoside-triphosphate reductase activating protein [Candidatus Omnitrophica bacterium]|nr:anaerobic ribonucleoside-triphosphate reductase activating protein [Candidatus Omnitrophota bacterium]MDE2009849.1 anaerobic ribonucleoside-triphosphate reductase activating protein [Candidatus Omnitrophota bacterium]MDE2214369.1 anaerobic ribonucleoside-triphosphate reductase activating protein [Candidatus Omnitrophota bacterium]MDE2231118.1 anaerobic ribonucleoside-triphosphate reductase activating protein [Candidatus Omnitrophota bacterium]